MSTPSAASDKGDKSTNITNTSASFQDNPTLVEKPHTAVYNQNANELSQFQNSNYLYHGVGVNGVGTHADGSQWSSFGKLPDTQYQAGVGQDNYDQDEANFVQSFAVQQQPFLSYPYLNAYQQPFANQLYSQFGYSFGQPSYGDVQQFVGPDGLPQAYFALPDGYTGSSTAAAGGGELHADGIQQGGGSGDVLTGLANGNQAQLFPQLYHVGNAMANLSLQDIQTHQQQLLQQQLYHQHLLQLQQQQQQLQEQLLQTSQQLALHTEQLGLEGQVTQEQQNKDDPQSETESKSQLDDKSQEQQDKGQTEKLEPQQLQQPAQEVQPTTTPEPQQQKPKQEGPRSWADIASKQASSTPTAASTTPSTTATTTTTTSTTTATADATTNSTPTTSLTPSDTPNVNPAQAAAGAMVLVKSRGVSGTGNPKTEATNRTPHKFNPTHFDYNVPSARFFVIKSYSEDDIHKSIKYNIWASTDSGNRRLDTAWKESSMRGPIYLFFSVNASGQFCGMARMTSALDYQKKSDLWAQDKWNGQFSVNWIFIKDIPNAHLRHIRLVENKPVTNSRDTQEIFLEPGREVLRIFTTFNSKTSILDDFSFYDKRQEIMKEKKGQLEDSPDEKVEVQGGELLPVATGEARKQRTQPTLYLTNSANTGAPAAGGPSAPAKTNTVPQQTYAKAANGTSAKAAPQQRAAAPKGKK